MQNNKSAREKLISKLAKLGIDGKNSLGVGAQNEHLESLLIDLEKIRDNRIARFVALLIQSQK
jgi:hypothetical protein